MLAFPGKNLLTFRGSPGSPFFRLITRHERKHFLLLRAVSVFLSSYVKAWERPQVSRARGAETRVECDAVHPNLPHGTWSARVSRHVSRARAAFDPRRRARGPIFTRFSRKRQRVWPVFSQATSGREFHEPARRIRETRARVRARTRARTRFYARGAFARARVPDPRRTADPPSAPPLLFRRSTSREGRKFPVDQRDARILTAFSNRSLPSQDVLRSSQSRSSRKSRSKRARIGRNEKRRTFVSRNVFPKLFH